MRRAFRVAVFCVLVLLVATPSVAQDTGWVIKTFDVQLAVQPDAGLLVTEDIAVDFRSLDKHGIYRDIPVRYRTGSTQERQIRIEDARVQGDPGTPTDLLVLDQGDSVRLRIGSPGRTVSGPHRYRLTYRVVGAMNTFDTHEELYWNVTGSQWSVPIEHVTARITGPAAVTRVACYMGPTGSTARCPEAELQQDGGRASAGRLDPGEGMTVVVAFPSGSVQVPPPELVSPSQPSQLRQLHPGTPARLATPGDFGIAALVALLLGAGLVRLYKRYVRDEPPSVPVASGLEERPPEGLRPALLSLLIHKRVGSREIAATLVDLAVRGYLYIEQKPGSWRNWRGDWLLQRTRVVSPSDPPLAEYERVLFNALFAKGDSVLMSELQGRFWDSYKHVRDLIYTAPEAQGWFSGRADRMRTEWGIWTFFALLGVLALTAWACNLLRFDIAVWFIPLVPGALALGVLASLMPRRTPAGSAMLQRALNFREFILTAEKRGKVLARQQDLFTELLPHAIAFGAEHTWAHVFSGLPDRALSHTPYGIWFIGAGGAFLGANELSNAVRDFGSNISGTLASTPASTVAGAGGSGFSVGGGSSGGGFGGGGGGSW